MTFLSDTLQTEVTPFVAGLSLRFQVAGYLSFVAGEVASSEKDYRPKKAIFIKSTAIISGFMMITSLLKKTTTF